ncbi:MAG: hypothetical protein AAGD14_03905 [Planctomycetota bacterium]
MGREILKLFAAALVGAAITYISLDSGTPRAARSRAPAAEAARVVTASFEVTEEERGWMKSALRKERERREDAKIGPQDGGLDVLRRYTESQADVDPVVREFDRFRARVRPGRGTPARLEATDEPITIVELPKGRETIEFGPGVFRIKRSGIASGRIERLEIRGAGMDRTMLVVPRGDMLRPTGEIAHLTIRNLTLDGGERGGALLDVRGRASVLLDRVRMRAWASGGYSAPLGTSGEVYLACDGCEFLGGYLGRGGTQALAVRGTSIISMRRCLFTDMYDTLGTGSGAMERSRAHFEDCTWENARLVYAGTEGDPKFPITVQGGTAHYDSPEKWGRDRAQEVRGTRFEPRIPRCRVRDLLAVADVVAPLLADGQLIQAVHLKAPNRAATMEFMVKAWTDPRRVGNGPRPRTKFLVTLRDGVAKVWPPNRKQESRFPTSYDGHTQGEHGDIRELVRRSSVDPSREAHGMYIGSASVDDGVVNAVGVRHGYRQSAVELHIDSAVVR